jgi:Xaa-Pro aminopeptidase
LAASFENSRIPFRQDSTFYYYTGINEPGVVLLVDLDNTRTLMVPQYAGNRSSWISSQLASIVDDPDSFGIDDIEKLGAEIPGYQMSLG